MGLGLADGQRFGIRYVIRIYRSDANQTGAGYYNAVWWAQGYENRYAAGRASTDLAPPYRAHRTAWGWGGTRAGTAAGCPGRRRFSGQAN